MKRLNATLLHFFPRHGLFHADRVETDVVARFDLPDFPQLSFGNGDRADKTAKAWAIAGEDHREVSGKVNCADRIFAVVNVRRMQTGFAAVWPGPARFRPDQPHAETVRVVVHLPVAGEKLVNCLRSKEIRCTMRPVEHADTPQFTILRDQRRTYRLRFAHRGRRGAGSPFRARNRQQIGDFQRTSGVAAKLPERKGGAATEVLRHINAVTHREIRAAADLRTAICQRLSGVYRDRLPQGHRFAIQRRLAICTRQGDNRRAVELQYRTLQSEFQPCRCVVVADNAIGKTKSKIVHRPRGRHTDVPVTEATRKILNAAPGPRLKHFNHRRVRFITVEHPRPHAAILEGLAGGDLAQIIKVSGDAVQLGGIKCRLQFCQHLFAAGSLHNQLGDHRIVKCRHFTAGGNAGIDTHTLRESHFG
ncbi:Uncharacterised protein [Salmonella enterica subsp. enterica serovar Typhi]|nr:Uncharacterised protein [Salmonella enterica subsp. enterica serovar Typhi]